MRNRRFVLLALIVMVVIAMLIVGPPNLAGNRVQGAVEIYASPVQAGCYIAGPSDCRIHVDPFTINLASGTKMVRFSLIAAQGGTGSQTVIYDWRPDMSNPAPFSGSTYSPSLVAQDFAVSCGKSYSLSLQGRDTSDPAVYNLGGTSEFTCPSSLP